MKLFSKIKNKIHAKNRLLYELQEQLIVVNNRVKQLQKANEEQKYKNDYFFWLMQRKENESMLETKRRVFKSLPKAEGECRKSQKEEILLLKDLKKICDSVQIDFFLLYGTMLGAYRHNGFIPWDDDIDVGMMFADYRKLYDLLKNNPEFDLQYHCAYNPWWTTIAKFKRHDSNYFIDIFLYNTVDLIENDIEKTKAALIEANNQFKNTISKRILSMYPQNPGHDIMIDAYLDEELKLLTCVLPNYGNGRGTYICNSIDSTFSRIALYPFEDVFELYDVSFEDDTYKIWKNTEVFLTYCYGDIWEFPNLIKPTHSDDMNK